MKRKIRATALMVSALLVVGSLGGCKNKNEQKTDGELTYWMAMAGNVSSQVSDFSETEIAKELEKRTGAKIKYIHPSSSQQTEKFNVMIAQNELPDMIEYMWSSYPGGPSKALQQGKIVDISQHLDKVPNLKKYLDEHEDIAKLVKTDDGKIFGFPFVRGDAKLCTSAGLIMRKDWLDELGLEVPETIDEWENVLRQFKEKKGAAAPLSFIPASQLSYGEFIGAYNTASKYYVDDDKVKYGPAEQGFKDFLKLMNKWYNEGLLDKSVATQDYKGIDAGILDGTNGAVVGSLGGSLGSWLAAAKDSDYDLVGVPYPTLNKGETPEFGHYDSPLTGLYVCISTSCKNLDLALKYLDYGYSEEGSMLYNFGIEGVSYNMVDGYPTYSELITNNPDGKPMVESMSKYIRAHTSGPFVQDVRYMEQYAVRPQQQEAWKNWTSTNASKHFLPQIYVDNETEIAKLQTDVETYYSEMLLKFIMGLEPIDNFDKYVQELNSRGLGKIIEAKQKAYDEFLAR